MNVVPLRLNLGARIAAAAVAAASAVCPLRAQDTAAILGAPAGKPAALQFREAHAGLVAADAARDKADYELAVRLYRESALEYARLSARYPDWEPGMTRFRRSYCENQIRAAEIRLDRALAEDGAGAPAAPAPVSPSEPAVPPALSNREAPATADAEPAPVAADAESAPAAAAAAADDRAEVLDQLRDTAADLIRQGKRMEARELLIRGIELNPDHAATRMLLGAIHTIEGQHEQAVEVLRNLVAEHPENARARVFLAAAYCGVGRILSAETELRKALELDNSLAEAHYNLALVLLAMDPPDREAAQKCYASSIKLGGPKDEAMEKALKEEQGTDAQR